MFPKHTPLAVFSLSVVFLCFSKYTEAQSNVEDFSNVEALSHIAMQFIIEYLNWRRIDHVILFDSALQRRTIPNNIIQMMDCMSKQGIYSSIYSTQAQITKETFRVIRHRLGVVVLLRYNETIDYNHILMKASAQRLYDEQHAWLLVTYGPKDDETTINLLRTLNLGLTTDFILSFQLKFDTEPSKSKSNTSCPIELPKKTFQTDTFSKETQTHKQYNSKSLVPFKQNVMENDKMNHFQHKISLSKSEPTFSHSIHSIQQPISVNEKSYFELIQVYKIRRDDETSAVFKVLGAWSLKTGFEKVNQFVPVEGRQDLLGFPLLVGFKNWSSLMDNSHFKGKKSGVIDVDVDDTQNLLEIMGFIAHSLNATVKYTPFQSVGEEIQEGVYSDLLNAVVKSEVDFGLEKVTVSYRKLNYMAFSHNIIKLSHNIYMHPSEFSVSRDIYLTPFSPKLLLCVLGMSLLLAFVMLIISLVANYRAKMLKKDQPEDVNVSYATLWIVGILAMQGSIWSPISSSGNMTLISSLMFAVIIYNSYAAFITSILSVKTSDINSLDDLFANGYKVGYIKESHDESYLTRDTGELKNIYLRGYDSRVSNVEEGLLKAAKTKFALFVSTQVARKAMQELEPYECRCQIQEFVMRATMEDVAFPMSKLSPYHKVINLGVMRLIESGTLSRIQLLMLPDMPTCTSDSSFVSAQLEDVITAVELLLIGIVLSIVVAIAECAVKYRRELRKNLKHGASKFGRKIKQTVENFEF